MTADVLTAFEDALKGQGCTVKRRNYDWAFDFGEGGEITIAAPWRIVRRGAIAHADTDDGQQFGLPAPIDGEVRCNDLLAQVRVAAVMVDRVTADICVSLRMELGWSCSTIRRATRGGRLRSGLRAKRSPSSGWAAAISLSWARPSASEREH